jgi:hypothetical protein
VEFLTDLSVRWLHRSYCVMHRLLKFLFDNTAFRTGLLFKEYRDILCKTSLLKNVAELINALFHIVGKNWDSSVGIATRLGGGRSGF